MAVGNWKGGHPVLCMRWMDATECGAPVRVPVGGRWERTEFCHDVGGREMVRGGISFHYVNNPVDWGQGLARVGERGHLDSQELQSIAIL